MEDKRLQFADKITLQRIELLHPKIRDIVKEAYLSINMSLPKGVRLRFTHTHRTIEEQNKIYAQGRTTPGNIVSYANGGQSIHNYGLAFDIVLLYDKDNNGTFETADWSENSYWKRVKDQLKLKGFTWGGDWAGKKRDSPHFEMNFGNNWSSLKTKPTFVDNKINYPII